MASEIANFLGAELCGANSTIRYPKPISEVGPGALCFINSVEMLDGIKLPCLSRYGGAVILTPQKLNDKYIPHIPCDRPRLAFARVLQEFFAKVPTGVAPSAVVAPCVKMGKNCYIKAGALIGGDGFGFEMDENGIPVRIPHLGGVVLGNHVEIGANTAIARGTLSDTVIGDHVKMDDNVFIAHNCKIGRGTMIVAGAVLLGSVTTGERVWIGGNACIKDNVKIGHDALIGIGAVVLRDVEPQSVMIGNPARFLRRVDE